MEQQRLAIVVVEVWLIMLASSKTRDLLWEKLALLKGMYAPLFLIFVLACLSVYAAMTYIAGSAVATGMLKAFGISYASFPSLRSAAAVATLITLGPEIAFTVLNEAVYSDGSGTSRWYDAVNLVWSAFSVAYFTICISEFAKSTLVQAFVAALMADFGVYVLTDVVFDRIDELLAAL